jgi:hypothetical protein
MLSVVEVVAVVPIIPEKSSVADPPSPLHPPSKACGHRRTPVVVNVALVASHPCFTTQCLVSQKRIKGTRLTPLVNLDDAVILLLL